MKTTNQYNIVIRSFVDSVGKILALSTRVGYELFNEREALDSFLVSLIPSTIDWYIDEYGSQYIEDYIEDDIDYKELYPDYSELQMDKLPKLC